MITLPAAVEVPLREDKDGAIRVGETRVLLEVIIAAYLQGDTPEQIASNFDVLKLEAVYAVITYYLTHRDEVDDYMEQVDLAGEEIRRQLEALPSYKPLTREMLLARLEARKRKPE
jgi:uncharacterized protein (DUF433 family)